MKAEQDLFLVVKVLVQVLYMYNHLQEVLADSTEGSDFYSSLDHFSIRCGTNKLSEQTPLKTDISSIISMSCTGSSYSSQNIRSEHLRNTLLQNFQAAFLLCNDGNSFYRLVGIEHIKYMIKNKGALEEFGKILSKEQFDLTILQNVSESFSLIDSREILSTIQGLVRDLAHCSSTEFADQIVSIMTQDDNVDFAVVAAYRLYTYFVGYRQIESELSMLLEGDQQLKILSYGCEVAPIIVKIIAQSLSARISIYTMMHNQIQLTSFGLEFSEHHEFELSLMLLNNHYSLLVERNRVDEIKKRRHSIKPVCLSKQPIKMDSVLEAVKGDVGVLDDEFFEEIYANMAESERRDIILQYIRENYQTLH